MAAQGGEAAAGSDPKPNEGWSVEQTSSSQYQPSASGHHAWSSSSGASWNYSVDNTNQNAVYYDPQRDVSVSGATQNVTNGAPHVTQPAVGTTNATNTYAPYSNSVQPAYNAAQYPNYYYNYPQPANDSSLHQGVDQSSGAAYQPLTSFPNSGSYVGPTSNTYYNAGADQTAQAYATNNYYYQNQAWSGGSSGDVHAQTYQTYAPSDTNAAQSSCSLPTTSFHYPQQYNQWSNYYDQSAPNSGALAVAGNSASDTKSPSAGSGYTYPSTQPPPPGTTQRKNDAVAPTAPPQAVGITGFQSQHVNQAPGAPGFQSQHVNQAPGAPGFQSQHVNQAPGAPGFQSQHVNPAPGVQGFQSQYVNLSPDTPGFQSQHVNPAPVTPGFQSQHLNQAPGNPGYENPYANKTAAVSGFQNHYINQAPAYQQNSTSHSQLPLSNQRDQQKALHAQGPSSNVYSVNHVNENSQPTLQGFAKTVASVNKVHIPTNPRIAPGFPMSMPQTGKKLEADSSLKPAYVGVSMPKTDMNAAQDGHGAAVQGSFPVSLCTYVERNLSRCKDDAQRSATQSIMKEMITKATADGTLHTKNWDIEPLLALPENAKGTNMTRRSPSRRTKSRWEPVAEEKVTNKVEVVSKEPAKSNACTTWENTRRTGNTWNLGNFVQSRQPPTSQWNQRPSKKQRIGGNANLTKNGNASSDSDKEQDLTKYYASSIALTNSPEEKKRREHRSKRFERGQGASSKSTSSIPYKDGAANVYTRGAISMLNNRSNGDGASLAVEDIDWDALTIKGTCQEIEKRYLRLTSAPDPATVRPEDVLEKALHMVETSEKNYLYKCDQLKSIRQDLTVQRIQNELTVKVYETHARLALQAGDLSEYNQCQSQLTRLYGEGIAGCHLEFSAYNLLCVMLHSNNKRDLLSSMASLSKEARLDETVKHALAVHSAVSSGNYVMFFKLYKKAPGLNSCLMDLYVERMRFEAIKCMSKSYRPTVPVRYVTRVLGFTRVDVLCEANVADGLEECEEWLKAHGAVLAVDENSGELQIDTKVSSASLYMPEPDNAVSHGDASLAVDDFLARAS
ncbi:SAC3 family protein A-like isoform X2 [Triticum urartu]|uniref:SAC3 family protein A-like isoform X2 n=1 Tax=Triticum urartu TaxID=4572 RepID=UPI002044B9A4|nr:SAC3 family protein A-like isoform X2 [Triticum urartu]XP_048558096.1 SAC3 family protein A-like isoform X2 [Triticum urartu]